MLLCPAARVTHASYSGDTQRCVQKFRASDGGVVNSVRPAVEASGVKGLFYSSMLYTYPAIQPKIQTDKKAEDLGILRGRWTDPP